jgi:predicted DNA-binding transcriptional regulator AlpA
MPTFRFNLIFEGIDFDDDETFEALSDIEGAVWSAVGTTARATATQEAPTDTDAVLNFANEVARRVPGARPVALDEDLVAIPDVASRVGMSREAVRLWANGSRQSHFPRPNGVVGDGIKVWAWADVNRWLQANVGLGDPYEFIGPFGRMLLNERFAVMELDEGPSAAVQGHLFEPVLAGH